MTSTIKEIENAEATPAAVSVAIPGEAMLPRVQIIDVGPTDTGLLSLLQAALPIECRNEITYHQLRIGESYAISPSDT